MTRAHNDILLVKQLGVVPVGTDEGVIQSYVDHLIANHLRLYGEVLSGFAPSLVLARALGLLLLRCWLVLWDFLLAVMGIVLGDFVASYAYPCRVFFLVLFCCLGHSLLGILARLDLYECLGAFSSF